MEVSFYPVATKGNKYSEIITSLLIRNGIRIYSLSYIFSDFSAFRRVDILHLNWFENLEGVTKFSVFTVFFKKVCKLLIFKLFRKKIVWTMHNKIPHDKSMLLLKQVIVHLLILFSDRIIIHSKVSEGILLKISKKAKAKIRYIPHPDYIGCYGDIIGTPKQIDGVEPLKLLFLGAVKPYKNIELLLDVVRPLGNRVCLTIAGTPQDSRYKQSLIEYSKGCSNVIFDLKFIPDDQISKYISDCDLLVMPYDLRSSLNSGTVILAFSYAKTVICPEIGTISDLHENSCVLSYKYESENEHLSALSSTLLRAIDIERKFPGALRNYGNEMFKYVSKENNKNSIVRQFVEVYEGIV